MNTFVPLSAMLGSLTQFRTHCLGIAATHSRLGLLISISNPGSAPQTYPEASLI